jgi:hypothetical protein
MNSFIGSFNDAVSVGALVLNDGMTDELEEIWKEVILA